MQSRHQTERLLQCQVAQGHLTLEGAHQQNTTDLKVAVIIANIRYYPGQFARQFRPPQCETQLRQRHRFKQTIKLPAQRCVRTELQLEIIKLECAIQYRYRNRLCQADIVTAGINRKACGAQRHLEHTATVPGKLGMCGYGSVGPAYPAVH